MFRHNMRTSGFLTCVTALSLLISSVAHTEDRGGYAGVFLRMGLGARAKAMGGAFVGNPVDGYSGYYNPAGLAGLTSREALVSYRNLSLDRSFQYVGFATPMPPLAGLALGWIHAGIDNIDGRDFTGRQTQMYSDSQSGFLVGFGIKIHDKLNIGVGGTYIRGTLLDVTSTGFGINLGLFYRFSGTLSFGLAARDLGAHNKWNSESLYERGSSTVDDFPKVITGGACYKIEKFNTAVLVDVFKNSKSKAGFRLGIEKQIREVFDLRTGIDDGNFTAGFGLIFPFLSGNCKFDYAAAASDIDIEIAHIISLGFLF